MCQNLLAYHLWWSLWVWETATNQGSFGQKPHNDVRKTTLSWLSLLSHYLLNITFFQVRTKSLFRRAIWNRDDPLNTGINTLLFNMKKQVTYKKFRYRIFLSSRGQSLYPATFCFTDVQCVFRRVLHFVFYVPAVKNFKWERTTASDSSSVKFWWKTDQPAKFAVGTQMKTTMRVYHIFDTDWNSVGRSGKVCRVHLFTKW